MSSQKADPLLIKVRMLIRDREAWHIDTCSYGVSNDGFTKILKAVEALSCWLEAQPVKDIEANTTARFILNYIIWRHGTPREIRHDQGPEFANKLHKEM